MFILDFIKGIIFESFDLLNQMSPYLLFGFFFAGLLHVFFSLDTIAKHLGKNSFGAVVKASMLGIPLPLCSCGVIPAAMSLKQKGASKGAVISFLISTPVTGVDSILATYSLMGLLFAIYRIIASFITAVLSGILSNIFFRNDKPKPTPVSETTCEHCKMAAERKLTLKEKTSSLFNYAFVELFNDISLWLVIGIFIGGIISFIIPDDFISRYIQNEWLSMIIMLLIGIPMYICSTGSLPIAAALMLKGLNPGAAFVFLVAGPATNAVTITIVSKELGKGAAALYLLSISVCSILMGWLLNEIWNWFQMEGAHFVLKPMEMLPPWVNIVSSIILIILILASFVQKTFGVRPI